MSDAMTAGTVTISGDGGDEIEAYLARPLDGRTGGGVVVIHHLPGYDEATKEMVRRFAAHGYAAQCPNLYSREAPGAEPDDAAAFVRRQGGVPDARQGRDGAARYLRGLDGANGKVGVIGYCSGGRQTFLAACSLDLDGAVDCYGAFVVNHPPEGFPVRMVRLLGKAPNWPCPLLGLFVDDDKNPPPEETAALSEELTRLGSPTSSTPTRARGTRSSRPTGRPTGPRRRTTAGRRSSRSSAEHLPDVCTYLTETVPMDGSGKGARGWFRRTSASVYVDHPAPRTATP